MQVCVFVKTNDKKECYFSENLQEMVDFNSYPTNVENMASS